MSHSGSRSSPKRRQNHRSVHEPYVLRRPDRRPRQTIRKVVAAGLFELRETTYAARSMRSVAARAGVSPASAYRYFPSKNALVATIYLDLLSDAPLHVDVNETTKSRVSATMHDMALVGADEPALQCRDRQASQSPGSAGSSPRGDLRSGFLDQP
ncbi:TetR/AcrR family transcriptional regulator [Mycobacterium pyrenivorans]|nr:TetR/AcrR family transcriptional regulator [Mycolicibacterium pyrenivorans]